MIEVSVRELKDRLAEYLRRAEGGEEIVVTRRGKAVASLSARPKREMTTEEKLRDMERRGIITRAKKPFKLPDRLIPLQGEGPSVSEMMLRDRGEPIP
jgi:prevent-host-death family protein